MILNALCGIVTTDLFKYRYYLWAFILGEYLYLGQTVLFFVYWSLLIMRSLNDFQECFWNKISYLVSFWSVISIEDCKGFDSIMMRVVLLLWSAPSAGDEDNLIANVDWELDWLDAISVDRRNAFIGDSSNCVVNTAT